MEQPDFVQSLRQDLADWRLWLARAIVLASAVAAGLAVVGFTWLCEHALRAFHALRGIDPLLPLLWTPLCTAAIVWATRRWFAGAAGSGIPQVIAALSTEPRHHGLFVSLKLSIAKTVLVAAGLFGGLAVGREGPSVQIAAGVMHHARRWLPARTSVHEHGLLIAGGAAGIAAAFNAPLAGIMFAIEELSRRMEQRNSGLLITAITLAGLVAISAFGNAAYFGRIQAPQLGMQYLLPGVLVVLCCGALGGVFARLLHASIAGGTDRFSRWRARWPVRFAAACGLAIAVIGFVSGGASFGSGYQYTRHLVEGQLDVPLLYVTLRIVATWLAVWSGVPGGIFAPSLAIGAGIGADVALATQFAGSSTALVAIGMAAFLAAVTQAPLTAFIIVMEMVDGYTMVLTLMAGALGASMVSRWISRPLYAGLAEVQLQRVTARG